MGEPTQRSDRGYRWSGMAAAICLSLILIANFASAQQAPGVSDATRELSTYFYKDPRPERLVGFLQAYARQVPPERWHAYPPVAGLLTFVFRAHPDWIDRLVPAQLDAQTAATIAAALRLSGHAPKLEGLQPRLRAAGLDPRLVHEFAGLPSRLEDLRISTGTHLDILWGASFASGDARYLRMILDFFAQSANRSELVALDIAQAALVMAGGPKDRMPTNLREKYGAEQGRQIIIAAAALWAMQSNARQHAFIEQELKKYIEDRTGTYAAKALAVFLAPRRGEQKL
jgi:hypothetical protein